jgi:WD40 repeat protein
MDGLLLSGDLLLLSSTVFCVGTSRTSAKNPKKMATCNAVAAGSVLAAAKRDYSIALLNTETYIEVGCLQGHEDGITCLSFSPDGGFLATGCWDHKIMVWDLTQAHGGGECTHSLITPECPNNLSFFRGGAHGLLASLVNGEIMRWDIAGAPVLVFRVDCNIRCGSVYAYLSFDDSMIVTFHNKKNGSGTELVACWDPLTCRMLHRLDEPAGFDSESDSSALTRLSLEDINAWTLSPVANQIAVQWQGDRSLTMIDLMTADTALVIVGPMKIVYLLAMTLGSDASQLASLTSDGFVDIWELSGGGSGGGGPQTDCPNRRVHVCHNPTYSFGMFGGVGGHNKIALLDFQRGLIIAEDKDNQLKVVFESADYKRFCVPTCRFLSILL